MSEATGMYVQVGPYGVALAWDVEQGITYSFFQEASLGVSGSNWFSGSIDPRNIDYFDNDPNDDVLDGSVSQYIGGGTPIGTPGIQFQVQKNIHTDDTFVSFSLGTEGIFEVGVFDEGNHGYPIHTVKAKDLRFQDDGVIIVTEATTSGNGYSLLNTYAVDENGDHLTPREAIPYLQDAGFTPNPINATVFEVFRTDGSNVEQIEDCFIAGTMIDMWPHQKIPDPNAFHVDASYRPEIWQKPIEDIAEGDLVISFDKNGDLCPSKVKRLFNKDAKVILDFFGTGVTPGHVYYRADTHEEHKFQTLIDIIRDDGVIETTDGILIRASTGLLIDDPRDASVQAITGEVLDNGAVAVRERGKLRLGTRFITDDGGDYCIADLISVLGAEVGDDGLIRVGSGEPKPFHWDLDDVLPKPEDYVLKRSGTSLDEIYQASEWESQRPHLPAPLRRDGGPIGPLPASEISGIVPNIPLAASDERYANSSRPMINRRRALSEQQLTHKES